MRNLKKYIQENLRKLLKENVEASSLVDFESFPPDVLKTLMDEYFDFSHTFDWNTKQMELGDKMHLFLKKNKSIQFLNKIDELIRKTREDIELIQKRKASEVKLQSFEELIKPALGDEALSKPLSKFHEEIILNPHLSPEEIERAFRNFENSTGLDNELKKLEKSDMFPGGNFNIPAFERYAKKNPEYMGLYKDWKKLHDEDFKLNFEAKLHAFRSSTPLERIQKLHNFLVYYKGRLYN